YLNGSIVGAAVFGTVLSSTNRTNLFDATTAASYASIISGLSPTADWLLSDTGTTAYKGTIPVLGSNQLCQRVLLEIQETQRGVSLCVYPASGGACATTPPSSALLSSFTSSSGPLGSSAPFTVLFKTMLGTASVAGVTGLHLLPDFSFSVALANWSAQVSYPNSGLLL
ncbi:MAG: hypothetical protein ACRDYB_07330, partial [Acidimicrobiales bacterium]